jgi:maltose alpha-D-glucosyltransferase/alpha-amylase
MMFNFWANQHLFLAIAREEATPLVEAYQQFPPMPPTAQWANFLRNHDEIDLGRLSDEDRALCFERFGPEESMQLYGRGVRRRLSPMLQGDRRRIELANSLIFTLPGTPVIRYGEEIGMGDDLSLKERDAIRTPMQWDGGPNGGFSTASPDRLARPVISEGEYRSERINVASQRLDPDSLLNWTERAIRARKESPAFGWGEMRLLETGDPAVMAHCMQWRGETVIAVHNFSRATRTVTLKALDGAEGMAQIFGRDIREPIQTASAVLDLDGYDYRWLRVRRLRS